MRSSVPTQFGGLVVAALLSVSTGLAADGYCPAYPAEQRCAHERSLAAERAFARLSTAPLRTRGRPRARAQVRNNLIDARIFAKMAADGVPAAPAADDAVFFRRASIDLTGRLLRPDEIEAFLADPSPSKRSERIDSLIASEAFIDNWTKFFAARFEVTSGYYNLIGVEGRNLFYARLRKFVAGDESYADLTVDLIRAAGDSYTNGAVNYLMRAVQPGDPVQDTWDVLTNRVTGQFLGVPTQCITCHDGANHLEKINLYLSARKREELLRLSAFFARMRIVEIASDAARRNTRGIVFDRPQGLYHGIVDGENPGPRPTRTGGPFTPRYFFDGSEPESGQWRRELARTIVNDRQFARAAVNYLWAHFFSLGIVDPPDAWDLARIDPPAPPPAPWTLQPSHPELLEELADEFIRSGYRIRPIVRLIANSAAYQLSSRHPGPWKAEYERYFAKHFPRRLSAEELYDGVVEAAGSRLPLQVRGWPQTVERAIQLPDPTEPFRDYFAMEFLDTFGRGDWWRRPSSTKSTVVQTLTMMNDYSVNHRLFGRLAGVSDSRVARMMTENASDDAVVRELFLASIGRPPSADELAVALAARGASREIWISDVLWALLNRVEFIFNY